MRKRRTAHRFGDRRRTNDVLTEEKVDFAGLMLSSAVLEGLRSAGFERPSPIQLKAIPLGRCGLDLIAQAKSGTGKTCVFSVIALENINLAVMSVQVLALAPTREIAVQIKEVMCSIGRHMKGLCVHAFIGGIPIEEDKHHLKDCHIAIGTPGRIKHLIENKLLEPNSIRLFILDEADRLLDDNFQNQTNWIFSTLPSSKQMLALSATYTDELAQHLKNYMKDPTFVRLNATDPALEGIRHYRSVVPFHSLPHKVFQEKVRSLLELLSKLSFHQCLIFSNYQIRARNLSDTLTKNGWPSTYISGSQGQNERLKAMEKLKEFKCRILISTDLTSRGIDAERVNLVINMDVPRDSETYLHRVGRAGRFGSYGIAVNFVAEGNEMASLNEVEAGCGVDITCLPEDVSALLTEATVSGFKDYVSLMPARPNHEMQGLQVGVSFSSSAEEQHAAGKVGMEHSAKEVAVKHDAGQEVGVELTGDEEAEKHGAKEVKTEGSVKKVDVEDVGLQCSPKEAVMGHHPAEQAGVKSSTKETALEEPAGEVGVKCNTKETVVDNALGVVGIKCNSKEIGMEHLVGLEHPTEEVRIKCSTKEAVMEQPPEVGVKCDVMFAEVKHAAEVVGLKCEAKIGDALRVRETEEKTEKTEVPVKETEIQNFGEAEMGETEKTVETTHAGKDVGIEQPGETLGLVEADKWTDTGCMRVNVPKEHKSRAAEVRHVINSDNPVSSGDGESIWTEGSREDKLAMKKTRKTEARSDTNHQSNVEEDKTNTRQVVAFEEKPGNFLYTGESSDCRDGAFEEEHEVTRPVNDHDGYEIPKEKTNEVQKLDGLGERLNVFDERPHGEGLGEHEDNNGYPEVSEERWQSEKFCHRTGVSKTVVGDEVSLEKRCDDQNVKIEIRASARQNGEHCGNKGKGARYFGTVKEFCGSKNNSGNSDKNPDPRSSSSDYLGEFGHGEPRRANKRVDHVGEHGGSEDRLGLHRDIVDTESVKDHCAEKLASRKVIRALLERDPASRDVGGEGQPTKQENIQGSSKGCVSKSVFGDTSSVIFRRDAKNELLMRMESIGLPGYTCESESSSCEETSSESSFSETARDIDDEHISGEDFDEALEAYLEANAKEKPKKPDSFNASTESNDESEISDASSSTSWNTGKSSISADVVSRWRVVSGQIEHREFELETESSRTKEDDFIAGRGEQGSRFEYEDDVIKHDHMHDVRYFQNKNDVTMYGDKDGVLSQASRAVGQGERSAPVSNSNVGGFQENVQYSEDTAGFYGASTEDFDTYLSALPARWKKSWYQEYERQTRLICEYAELYREGFSVNPLG